MRRLTALFPSEFLKEHAEELGVVERESKLQVPMLVFRRSDNSTADKTISLASSITG